MLKKSALLAVALAVCTALQPMPKAEARGEGVAVLLGVLGGVAAAAEANARQQQAAMVAAANPAVRQQACLQWLPVVNDQRYDAAMRAQAVQIVAGCGIAVPYVASAEPRR